MKKGGMGLTFVSRLVEAVLDHIPADRSAAVIFDGAGNPVYRAARPLNWEDDEEVGRKVMRRAMALGQPLLIEDLGVDPELRASLRGHEPGPSSILCVPLPSGNGKGGAIYMDRRGPAASFSKEDLVFVAAACSSLGGLLHFLLAPGKDETEGRKDGVFVGGNGRLRGVEALIERVKDSDAPVFICGESGTGKDLVARTIHATGIRKPRPFVAVNCGAIPEELLESELFGHARGAFTGAIRDKAGLIEEAQGGTFFLDEIGDLSLPLQAKLLRAVEEKSIRRIGENRTRTVDVRWISATNKDLEREVGRGAFREDLFYRLRIISIELPPLRERREEILPLLNHFTEKYAREMNRDRPFFSPRALELLLAYAWPGNIRELQNEVRRCLILVGGSPLIREEVLSSKINPREEAFADTERRFFEARADFEKRFLSQALARCDCHRSRTAAEVGLTRQGLFKLMKKHGLMSQRPEGQGSGY